MRAGEVGSIEVRVGNNRPNVTQSDSTSDNLLYQYFPSATGTNTPFNATCPSILRGRYVSIQRVRTASDPALASNMSFCEVEVFGSPYAVVHELAASQPAFQSGDNSTNHVASKAVDQLVSGSPDVAPYCSVTSAIMEPWW